MVGFTRCFVIGSAELRSSGLRQDRIPCRIGHELIFIHGGCWKYPCFHGGTGGNGDPKEYKPWKAWIQNKLLTLGEKVPESARGAYVFTCLAGKALECVEHIEPTGYRQKSGELVLFKRLDERFPQRDQSDEMTEVLTKISY